jgi:hypothetical protein
MRLRLRKIVLVVTCFVAPPAFGLPIEVGLSTHPAPREPLVARVFAERPGFATATATVGEPGRYFLDLAPGPWTVRVQADGWWADASQVLVPAGGEQRGRHEIVLVPGSVVSGTIELADGKVVAGPPRVSYRRPDLADRDRRIDWIDDAQCTQGSEGRFHCNLPAGTRDLRLRVTGYVNAYFWERLLPARGELALGKVRLQPGTSVVGWVVVRGGEVPPDRALVRVEVAAGGGVLEGGAEAIAKLRREVRPNGRGFFQVDGLAPGGYLVSAQLPGFASAEARVMMAEGLEARLREPLELARPLAVEVFVDPPLPPAQAAPGLAAGAVQAAPWSLRVLRRRGGQVVGAKNAEVSPAGSAVLEDLAPGSYLLQLLDASGRGWYALPDWLVEPGMPPLFITLDIVEIRGRVTLGGEPLAGASLSFGGARAPLSLPFISGEDGEFTGALPRVGRWPVDIAANEPLVRRSKAVEVPRPRRGVSRFEIALTDARIAGRTVRVADGLPFPGATVELAPVGSAELPLTVDSDENGEFSIRGLEADLYGVSARAKDARSDIVAVRAGDAREPADVTLRMRPTVKRTVQVLGPHGPVVGAR